MRVVHVIDNLRSGGKERQCVELLKGLSGCRDLESMLVVLSAEVFYDGLTAVPNLRVAHVVRRFRKDAWIVAHLYRRCRSFAPDVVVAYDSMSAVCVAPVARLLGARFVNAMVQDAPLRIPWKLRVRRRLSFPLADAIVGNSQAGMRAYRVPMAKARVIRNGFDVRRLEGLRNPGQVRADLELGDRLVVGMVANFSRFKDHPTFLRAAQHILATRRDVVFVMVGGGETMDACRRAVMPANQDGLLFAGDRADVESIVNVFDVGALATFTEGIPNAIMEYMALGKPVVASGGGGIPELMVDGETGFLTEAGDASGFAARIGWLLGDETRRRTMGEAGRDRIAREFSLERMTEAHRGLYDELVARASAPR